MRRIIERTVTIVTTTIWRISWEEEGLPSRRRADPQGEKPANPGVRTGTTRGPRRFPAKREAMEVDAEISNHPTGLPADVMPPESENHPSLRGEKKS